MDFYLNFLADNWWRFLITALAAYLLGSINTAVLVTGIVTKGKKDIRQMGSGNAGFTNVLRSVGKVPAIVTIVCDALKCVVAVLLGGFIFSFIAAESHILSNEYVNCGKYIAGIFCILGHSYPVYFHFKGGKGILSGGTIALMIDWRIALVVWGGFLILTILTRYVSLGSLWAGASFPFISWYCYPDPVIVVLAFACGGLVVWQHRGNIQRLLHGNENKFSLHRKTEGKS